MVKHPAVRIWIKRGLVNSIEGLYLAARMQRQADTPASALAAAGFKEAAPFLEALDSEARQATADKGDFPEGPLFAGMTFDTFVQTSSYVSVVELLFRVCRDSPLQSKSTSICGAYGLGKTHLLNATEHEIRRIHPERRTVLVNMLDLAIALIRARRRGNRGEFINFLCGADTLLIDDIQLCEADGQIQECLLEIMERQPARDGRRLVLSCDVDPGRLQLSDGRLKAAIASITTAELKPLDRVERGLMVTRLAGGFNLPAQVMSYIAENVTGNVGELKAALTQLIAAARHGKREIGLELVMDIVSLAVNNRMQETGTINANPGGDAGTDARATGQDPGVLKEMIRSARDGAEHVLANEIALSQMINVLSYKKSAPNGPPIARLKLALQAIREGDMETASGLMQHRGPDLQHNTDASIPVSEDIRGPGAPRQ